MLQSKSHGFSLLTSSSSAWFRGGGSSRSAFTRLKLYRRGAERDTSSRKEAEADLSSGQGKRRMPKVPHLPLDRLRRPYSPLRLRRTAALTSTSDDEDDDDDVSCSMVYRSDESLPMTLSVSTEENNFPTMDTELLLLDCNCCTDQLDRQTCHYFFPTTGGKGVGTPASGRETAATLEAFPQCSSSESFPLVTSYCTPMKASIGGGGGSDSVSSSVTDSPALICVSRGRRQESVMDEEDTRTVSFNFTSVLTPSLTQRTCGKPERTDRLFSRLPLQSAAGLFGGEEATADGSRVSTTCTNSSFSYGGGCCAVGGEASSAEALVSYFSIQTSGSHSARFCTARGEEILPTFQRCRSTIKADNGILPTSQETTTLLLTLNQDVSQSKKKKLPHFLPHCRNKSAMPILRRHRHQRLPMRRRSSASTGPPSFVVLLTARRRQYKLKRKQEKRIRRRLRRRELYGKYVRRHRARSAAAVLEDPPSVDFARQFPSRIPIGETLELEDDQLCAPQSAVDNEEDDEDIVAENGPDDWPQVAEDDSYYFPKLSTRRRLSQPVQNSSLEEWVVETIDVPSCLDHKMVTTSPSALESSRPHYCRDSFRGLLKLVVKRRKPRSTPS